jgi:hypothetical protein
MNIVARVLPPFVVIAGFIASAKWLAPEDTKRECESPPVDEPPIDWREARRRTIDEIRDCYRDWWRENPVADIKLRVLLDRTVRALHVAGPSQDVLYCLDRTKNLRIEEEKVFEFDVEMTRARLSIAQTEHFHPMAASFYGGDFRTLEEGVKQCFVTYGDRELHDSDAEIRARTRLTVREDKVYNSEIYAGPQSPALRRCLANALYATKFHGDPASVEIDVGLGWIEHRVEIDARVVAVRTEIQ